jgi:ribokinase
MGSATAAIIPMQRESASACEVRVRVGVVGHVEWVEFARVAAMPRAGEIVHATENWSQAAGGGAVAAIQLARLAGEATLFTALSGDDLGLRARESLEADGVHVQSAAFSEPQRRAFTHVEESGERTITVLGDKLRPRGGDDALAWHDLAGFDGVLFISGDVEALRRARRARVLVATARELATLRLGAVELDALVGSGEDEGERYRQGDLDTPPELVVSTAGALGGWAQPGGPFTAAPVPGPIEDAYGCGDCFAAGLTYALAAGRDASEAVAFAARCGAAALTGRGVHAADVAL